MMNKPQPITRPLTLEPCEIRHLLKHGHVDLRRIIFPAPSMMGMPYRSSKGSPSWVSGSGLRTVWHECPFRNEGFRFWVREYFSAWFDGCHWKSEAPSHRSYSRLSNIYYRVGHNFPDDDQSWVRPAWMPQWLSRSYIKLQRITVQQKSAVTTADVARSGHPSLVLWKASVAHPEPQLQSLDDWFWVGRFELYLSKKPGIETNIETTATK